MAGTTTFRSSENMIQHFHFLLLIFGGLSSNATTTTDTRMVYEKKVGIVLSSFSQKRENELTHVEVKYDVSIHESVMDAADGQAEPTVIEYLKDHPGHTVLNANGMKNGILQVILNAAQLEPMIEYPDHIERIIDLIEGMEKRAQARSIYADANLDKIISHTSKSNFSIEDGRRLDRATYTYSFTVSVQGKTSLTIPSFIFTHNNRVLQTKELVIEME